MTTLFSTEKRWSAYWGQENCLTRFHCGFNAFGMITKTIFSFLDIWVSQKIRKKQNINIFREDLKMLECELDKIKEIKHMCICLTVQSPSEQLCYTSNMLACIKDIMTTTVRTT